MRRILILTALVAIVPLLVNVMLAACFLMVEVVSGWGVLSRYTGWPQSWIATYFHATGISMIFLLALVFGFIWVGPDIHRYLKKKEES